jgi:hypothetical protein
VFHLAGLPGPSGEMEASGKVEHYSTPSDYMRSLIREDMRRRDEQKLKQMLLEGVRSGRGMEIGSKEWKKFWEDIHARIQEKTKTRT